MVEIFPIKHLREEDGQIFGSLNVSLAKIMRRGVNVPNGIVVTAPAIKLQTTLSHFDLGHKEIFEQSLQLVSREINRIPIPKALADALKGKKYFFVDGKSLKTIDGIWVALLTFWMEEIKQKLWMQGFSPDLTKGLDSVAIFFIEDIRASGSAILDEFEKEVKIIINFGTILPETGKEIETLVNKANKILLIPHSFSWIAEKKNGKVSLVGIAPHVAKVEPEIIKKENYQIVNLPSQEPRKTATKIFADFSEGTLVAEHSGGVYISMEKIINLENKFDSFENLILRITEAAKLFRESLILLKLPDIPETLGGVRGSLRLIHQKSLLDDICKIIIGLRNKQGLTNINLAIPYLRAPFELEQIKRELVSRKITRKPSLQFWLEVCLPENILNIEDYLEIGLDGVVLNLDELMSALCGFDYKKEELAFYKKEVKSLIKFLSEGLKTLHKSKIPVLAYGSLILDTALLEFLVENGIYGVVAERYEVNSINDLLYQVEKKLVLKGVNN